MQSRAVPRTSVAVVGLYRDVEVHPLERHFPLVFQMYGHPAWPRRSGHSSSGKGGEGGRGRGRLSVFAGSSRVGSSYARGESASRREVRSCRLWVDSNVQPHDRPDDGPASGQELCLRLWQPPGASARYSPGIRPGSALPWQWKPTIGRAAGLWRLRTNVHPVFNFVGGARWRTRDLPGSLVRYPQAAGTSSRLEPLLSNVHPFRVPCFFGFDHCARHAVWRPRGIHHRFQLSVVSAVLSLVALSALANRSCRPSFPSSISAMTMAASCLAVGSLPFSSPGSFDCNW